MRGVRGRNDRFLGVPESGRYGVENRDRQTVGLGELLRTLFARVHDPDDLDRVAGERRGEMGLRPDAPGADEYETKGFCHVETCEGNARVRRGLSRALLP